MGIHLGFNADRARIVFRILEDLWVAKDGVFTDVVLPQDIYTMPLEPRDMAHWLFYNAIPMRGGVVSEGPMHLLKVMREQNSDLFDPVIVAAKKYLERDITRAFVAADQMLHSRGNQRMVHDDLFDQQHTRRSNHTSAGALAYKESEHPRSWIHNSRVLAEYWEGNILNVFAEVSSFEEAFARIDYKSKEVGRERGLVGIRRKIFALLVIWLQEKDLIPRFHGPIPVDFHALRMLIATGILEISWSKIGQRPAHRKQLPNTYLGRRGIRVTESLIDQITIWSDGFMQENGFSHLAINPALWILSRTLCADHQQNKSAKNGALLFDAEYLRETGHWPANYSNPCSCCPIQQYCTMAVPNRPYYLYGILLPLERVAYPHNFLPIIESLYQNRKFVTKPKA